MDRRTDAQGSAGEDSSGSISGGRTVIPGLTDGHIHGIRAALTFGTEINCSLALSPASFLIEADVPVARTLPLPIASAC